MAAEIKFTLCFIVSVHEQVTELTTMEPVELHVCLWKLLGSMATYVLKNRN